MPEVKAKDLQVGDIIAASSDQSGVFSVREVELVDTKEGSKIRVTGPLGIQWDYPYWEDVKILNVRRRS